MYYTIFLKINPECSVLRQISSENYPLSLPKLFCEHIQTLYQTKIYLQLLETYEFTDEEIKAISRGAQYAITPSLRKKFAEFTGEERIITLTDLQTSLKKEFYVEDKRTNNFIIKTILDNDSILFALVLLLHSFKLYDFIAWGNDNNNKDKFKYTLKAKLDSKKKNIVFEQELIMKNSPSKNTQGSAYLQFSVNQSKEIKLLPLTMRITCTDKQEFDKYKNILFQDFQNWIFQPKPEWQIKDLWVISNLLGCFVGLSAMVNLLALSIATPISPLLLPLIGWVIGLCLSSMMHSYVCSSLEKKDYEKFEKSQQPIYFSSTTTFFNRPKIDKFFTTAKTFFELKS